MVSASRWFSSVATGVVVLAGGCALGPAHEVAKTSSKPLVLSGTQDRGPAAAPAPKRLLGRLGLAAPDDSAVRLAGADSLDLRSRPIRQVSGTILAAPLKALSSHIKNGVEIVSGAFAPPVDGPQDPTSLSVKSKPSPQLFLAMARLAEQSGHMAEAEQRYRQAMQLAPQDLSVLLGYARMKDRQGYLDEAVGLYKQAAKAHPKNAAVHNDLGLCLARRKDLKGAVAALEQAIRLEPEQTLYRNNIATVLVEMGDVDAAFGHLTAVHSQAVAYYNVGYLLEKKGQPKAAAALFAQALKMDPSLAQARAWLSKLNGRPGQDPAAAHQAVGGSGLEDPSVEAPDLRSARRPMAIAARRRPPIGAFTPPKPASRPAPGITTPPAATSPPPASRVRQLPPVFENRRRSSVVVPQSFEDAPLPGGEEPDSGEAVSSDGSPASETGDAAPAPLPDDAEDAAVPLPAGSEPEQPEQPSPEPKLPGASGGDPDRSQASDSPQS